MQLDSSIGLLTRIFLASAVSGLLVVAACDSSTAPCFDPAPYRVHSNPAPGYFVGTEDGVDAAAVAEALGAKYGFEVTSVLPFGFSATFTDQIRESLRCEPAVEYIETNIQPEPPPGG